MTEQAFLAHPPAPAAASAKVASAPVAITHKAAGAYRTISEAADELGVPQHVLRFWETKFSQIRPMKRSGGRRFYRPEDIALISFIQKLLYEQGYTIKGVQRLLKLRRSSVHTLGQTLQDTLDDLSNEPFAAVAPAPVTLSPIIEIKPARAVLEQAPVHVLEQIPDHLPARPASLMATGLQQGNPTPVAPVEASPEENGPTIKALSASQRQQLGDLLGELKALKSLLN